MPWQQQVIDTALEKLPDGDWAYSTVIVTVQRQAGKTAVVAPVSAHRCLAIPRAKVWYTAQTRTDARQKFVSDYMPTFRASPLASRMTFRESNGSEAMRFPGGSSWGIFAPNEEALHGGSNNLVVVDEGWAFDVVQGEAMEAAITPTFSTVDGQLWIVSAGGTAASTWLNKLIDIGRAAAEADTGEGVAFFDWGIPEGADAADLDVIARHHPAYGYTLRPRALAAAQQTMTAGEFARAYGNVPTKTAERTIKPEVWAAGQLGGTPAQPEPGAVVLIVDASPDGDDAAIGTAWQAEGGPVIVEIADHRPGTDWVPARLRELAAKWEPSYVVYDDKGPARHLVAEAAAELENGDPNPLDDIPIHGTTTGEYVDACAVFMKDLGTAVKLVTHPGLDKAAEACAKRTLGDGWAWTRRRSAGSISPLVVATLGPWAWRNRPDAPDDFAIL